MPSGEREPIWNSNFEDGDTLHITVVVSDIVPDPEDPTKQITTFRTPSYIGHVDNVQFGTGYSRTDLNAMTKQEILDLGASLEYEMETTSSNTKDEIIEDFLACQYDAI